MQFAIETQETSFRMVAAVLLYAEKKGHYSGDEGMIATVHEVSQDQHSRPRIRAGRPMKDADYTNMVRALAPKDRPEVVWQESNVLARGAGRTVWWTPAMQRAMFFKASSWSKTTFEGHALCPVPPMIWVATERDLFMYAVNEDTRPERNTKLYQAPLFNVWSSGKVCQGSTVLPPDELRGIPMEWEKSFFSSNFTHPNFAEKDRLIKGKDPVEFWKEMIDCPPPVFPLDRLVDVGCTVEDLLAPDMEARVSTVKARGEF